MNRAVALVGALALVLMSNVTLPSIASAAPNAAIVVKDIVLKNDTRTTSPNIINDTMTLDGKWDASDANPQPGDTFTITLPAELGFPGNFPFPLKGNDGDGNEQTWANCLTNSTTQIVTCTLTSIVTQFPDDVLGTFQFQVKAIKTTKEENVQFKLNGQTTAVDLPGTGGISDGVVLPTEMTKSGVQLDNKWSFRWTINVPGAALASKTGNVDILEELSANHELCDSAAKINLVVQTVRGSTVTNVSSIGAISTTGVTAPTDFKITLTRPTGGFNPDVTYRISYNTCTPDEQIDPKGTVYNNKASIDGVGDTGTVGVTQTWDLTGVNKSGFYRTGTDRYSKATWTVTALGSQLLGKNSFTLDDELTLAHQLCPDTVSGIQIFERYGPSSTKNTNITAQFDATDNAAATATSFSRKFTIKSGSTFTFKNYPYIYLIQYTTCSTATGLPAPGTKAANQATIEGVDSNVATVEVPGRQDDKVGVIDSAPVENDGITLDPQTSIGWYITIPGERLNDINTDLTITDKLSATHQVCPGNGGDLKTRLSIYFGAQDQVGGGGLATVDLSSSVTVSQAADGTITFKAPPPTLPKPGGGTATGFSREYKFILTYRTCTTSGGMDVKGTVYGNTAEVAGKTYTSSQTQQFSASGTGQGVNRGSVLVSKAIADNEAAAFVPDGTNFTVHVKEYAPTGTLANEYNLSVPANGAGVKGLTARGTGWKLELSEPTFPNVPGVTFGAPVFSGGTGVTLNADKTVATVAVTPRSNIAVKVTNTAQLGQVSIQKKVDGAAAALVDPNQTYSVTAKINVAGLGGGVPAQPDRTFTLKAGDAPTVLKNIPIGASVTFTEVKPADDDNISWGTPTFSPATVVVPASSVTTPTAVTVTNHAERKLGQVTIAKKLDGGAAGLISPDQTYAVTAKIDTTGLTGVPAQPDRTFNLKAGDAPTLLAGLPIGSKVTFTEVKPADTDRFVWGTPTFSPVSGTVTVTAASVTTPIAATVTNHVELKLGQVSIAKKIDGAAADLADPTQNYSVTAKIDTTGLTGVSAQPDRTFNLKAGAAPTVLKDLPVGAKVTFTEVQPTDDDTITWGTPTFSAASTTVTAASVTTPIAVTVTNHAERTVGTFSVSKDLIGTEKDNAAVPDSFTVNASWKEGDETKTAKLTLPKSGTPVPLGVNLPVGTKVTLSEEAPADGSGITWGAPVWSGTGVSVSGQTVTVTVTRSSDAKVQVQNLASKSVAGLSLTKGIAGAAAGEVRNTTDFRVTATWTDSSGDEQTKTLIINPGKVTPFNESLPAGTVVTLTELERPSIDTVRWGDIVFSGDDVTKVDANTATVKVSALQNATTLVTVSNEANWAPGTFAVSKSVEGIATDNANYPASVKITASWTEGGDAKTKELTVPTDGTSVPFGDNLPYGTEVTLTETEPASDASFTWAPPEWTGPSDFLNGNVVTIGAATNTKLHVTNTAVEALGSLNLTKTVVGPMASELPANTVYPFTLTWKDLLGKTETRTVQVGAGKTVTVEDLPVGTKVSLVESAVNLPSTIEWAGVDFDVVGSVLDVIPGAESAVFEITDGSVATGTLVAANSYQAVGGGGEDPCDSDGVPGGDGDGSDSDGSDCGGGDTCDSDGSDNGSDGSDSSDSDGGDGSDSDCDDAGNGDECSSDGSDGSDNGSDSSDGSDGSDSDGSDCDSDGCDSDGSDNGSDGDSDGNGSDSDGSDCDSDGNDRCDSDGSDNGSDSDGNGSDGSDGSDNGSDSDSDCSRNGGHGLPGTGSPVNLWSLLMAGLLVIAGGWVVFASRSREEVVDHADSGRHAAARARTWRRRG